MAASARARLRVGALRRHRDPDRVHGRHRARGAGRRAVGRPVGEASAGRLRRARDRRRRERTGRPHAHRRHPAARRGAPRRGRRFVLRRQPRSLPALAGRPDRADDAPRRDAAGLEPVGPPGAARRRGRRIELVRGQCRGRGDRGAADRFRAAAADGRRGDRCGGRRGERRPRCGRARGGPDRGGPDLAAGGAGRRCGAAAYPGSAAGPVPAARRRRRRRDRDDLRGRLDPAAGA